MAQPTGIRREYLAVRRDSTGKIILAYSSSDAEAESKADQLLADREAFLALPRRDQLKTLTAANNMTPLEVEDAVKVMAEILLAKPHARLRDRVLEIARIGYPSQQLAAIDKLAGEIEAAGSNDC